MPEKTGVANERTSLLSPAVIAACRSLLTDEERGAAWKIAN